jgi:hypothetical protein
LSLCSIRELKLEREPICLKKAPKSAQSIGFRLRACGIVAICIKPFGKYYPLMEKTVVERLQTFGISEMEASLYLTLLNNGEETAGELADVTRIARADVYKTLNGLLEKAMIEESVTRPTKYCAVSIEVALDAAVMKQAYHLRQMERSKQELVELVNRHVPIGPSEATFF